MNLAERRNRRTHRPKAAGALHALLVVALSTPVLVLAPPAAAQDETAAPSVDKIAVAKAFMAEYIKRSESYDAALSMMFDETAWLKFQRHSDAEPTREMTFRGHFWRNMYTKSVPKMQAAGDREIFYDLTYEAVEDGVSIKGRRRQVRQNFVGPFEFVVKPDPNGTWRIFEYYRHARAPSSNVFINLGVGVAVDKPNGWGFLARHEWSEQPRRVNLTAGWLERLAKSNPLTSFGKSTAGVDTPEASAKLFAYPETTPLAPLSDRLEIATKLLSESFEGTEPLGAAESMELENVPALRRRYKTTLLFGEGQKMPAVRELVVAQRDGIVFVLDLVCPLAKPGTDLLDVEDDFELIRESLWIDTTPIR